MGDVFLLVISGALVGVEAAKGCCYAPCNASRQPSFFKIKPGVTRQVSCPDMAICPRGRGVGSTIRDSPAVGRWVLVGEGCWEETSGFEAELLWSF